MIGAMVLTVSANLSAQFRLNEGMSSAMFISYIAYTVWWCVKIFTAFRIPKDE